MKMLKSKTWQHEITGSDRNVILFGVNIFDYENKLQRNCESYQEIF